VGSDEAEGNTCDAHRILGLPDVEKRLCHLCMIEIIVGTNRPESCSSKVADKTLGAYKSIGAEARLLSLAELPTSIFAPTAYETKPDAFTPFAERVVASSGLVVVTPEYNGSFPGILKYFIDMLPFPESFEHRPVCFIGIAAGQWGAMRSVEQLQQIFGYRNAHIFPERVFIPGVYKYMHKQGGFVDDKLESRIKHQADGFTKFIDALQG